MSSIINDPYHGAGGVFGFYVNCKDSKTDAEKKRASRTIANIVGWIPIIEAFIGAIRVVAGIRAYKDAHSGETVNKEVAEQGYALIGRGIAEILCMGLLLMIVDLVIAAVRNFMVKPAAKDTF